MRCEIVLELVRAGVRRGVVREDRREAVDREKEGNITRAVRRREVVGNIFQSKIRQLGDECVVLIVAC